MTKLTQPALSPREVEVIKLLAQNLDFATIGERMGIGIATTKSYSDRARLKLGVKTARELPAAYQAATGDNPWPS